MYPGSEAAGGPADGWLRVVVWAAAVAGFAQAVTAAKAGAPVRALADAFARGLARWGRPGAGDAVMHFVRCPLCVGWWAALGFAVICPGWRGPAEAIPAPEIVRMGVDAFAGLAVCWAASALFARP